MSWWCCSHQQGGPLDRHEFSSCGLCLCDDIVCTVLQCVPVLWTVVACHCLCQCHCPSSSGCYSRIVTASNWLPSFVRSLWHQHQIVSFLQADKMKTVVACSCMVVLAICTFSCAPTCSDIVRSRSSIIFLSTNHTTTFHLERWTSAS